VDVEYRLEHGQPGKYEEATVIRPSATFSRQQVEPEEQANGLPNRSIYLFWMFQSFDRSLLLRGGFQHNGHIMGTLWSRSHSPVYALLTDSSSDG
jgi:hypothetical protein